MISIHRYLLIYLITALTLGSLMIAVLLYKKSAAEINELYDSNMEQLASALTSQFSRLHFQDLPTTSNGKYALNDAIVEEEEFLVQVWDSKGELVYTSHPLIILPQLFHSGFTTQRYEKEKWRVYSLATGTGVIKISQPQNARRIYIRKLAAKVLMPVLLQIPLISILIWIAVGRSLRHLNQITNAIQIRSASSLEPLDTRGVPKEIRPLIDELNSLLSRLGNAIELQRNFTANAAHELRTPLAALQLQSDILADAKNHQQQKEALATLDKGIRRATSIVAQLLTLARLGPEFAKPFASIELNSSIKPVLEDLLDLAASKSIDLGFESDEPVYINGNLENFQIMVRNLVENAIKYSPNNSKVDISIYQVQEEVVLDVKDEAKVITPGDKQRIFERFYRGVSGNDASGSGLGLAIVRDIVKQHIGRIEVIARSDAPGNKFVIIFPKLNIGNKHV